MTEELLILQVSHDFVSLYIQESSYKPKVFKN